MPYDRPYPNESDEAFRRRRSMEFQFGRDDGPVTPLPFSPMEAGPGVPLAERLRRQLFAPADLDPSRTSITADAFAPDQAVMEGLRRRVLGVDVTSAPTPPRRSFLGRVGDALGSDRARGFAGALAATLDPTASGAEGFLGSAAEAFTQSRGLRDLLTKQREDAQGNREDRALTRRNMESLIAERGRPATSGVTPEYIDDPTDPTMQVQVDRDRLGNRIPALFNGQPIRRPKAAGRAAGGSANISGALRREFNTQIVPHQVIARSARAIENAAMHPTAANDLSLIFAYMKILDPGSTVREGEFANAQNAGGVEDRIVSFYNRVKNGERLSDQQRAGFLESARGLVQSQRLQAKQYIDRYSQLARLYGFDPSEVVSDPYNFPVEEVAPPPRTRTPVP